MTRYSRADWHARSANGGPGSLVPANVEGIAFHWPAMSKPLRGFAAVAAALRGWQNYHIDGQGWSDIGYQVAVDQDGNRYELRGLRTQSGANGDSDVNRRYCAVLLILAPGEKPTDAMVREVRAVVTDARKMYPGARSLVGHGDIRPEPTACPGPLALAAIRAGEFEPQPKPKPERPWTQGPNVDDAKAALRKARRESPKARKEKVTAVLERIRATLPKWRKRG